MRVKMTFAVLAIATLALAVPASSTARTVHVEAGESIQAAIDDARPGTTIKVEEGTYAESLLIDKDGIELVGEGRKKTHIVPPPNPTVGEGCVAAGPGPPAAPIGICVFDVDPATFEPLSTVEDVEISHLSVDGFEFTGVFFLHTRDGELTRTILSDYGEYGVFALDSSGTKISRNVAKNTVDGVSPEAGIYVGDSPNADATVWKNVSYGNHDGFFIRDAAHGKLLDNKSFGNCLGIAFLNTDETFVPPDAPPGTEPGEPVDVADWRAEDNTVAANNRTCPANEEEGLPPLSGIGIAVLGGVDIELIDNGVYGNKTPADFTSAFGGGILVVSSPEFTPAKPSTGTKVAFNQALGNDPDLFWDGEGDGNRFFANDCLTSQPDGLCDDSHLGRDGHHGGDHGDDRDHGDRHHKKPKKHKGGKRSKNKKRYKHHDD